MLAAVVAVLYVATAIQAVFLLLLYRQFGLLALGSAEAIRLPGPRVGRVVRRAPMMLVDIDGRGRAVRLAAEERHLFVLFVLPGSPFDAELADAARTFAARLDQSEQLLIVSRSTLSPAFARRVGDGVTMLIDPDGELFRTLDLQVGPYMFAVDRAGALLWRDLVNTLDDLEQVRDAAKQREAQALPRREEVMTWPSHSANPER